MKKIIVTLCLAILATGCSGKQPKLGIVKGQLQPCPPTPNCISSLSAEEKHATQAFYFAGTSTNAWQVLAAIIKDMPRTEIISQTGTYMHVEFTSAIFRFVDDVEFLLKPQEGKIEVRSASRLGRSDFGVNRKRIREIRKLFSEQCAVAVREIK